jgi:hypothetical protein
MNRAAARGQTLHQALLDTHYFPPRTQRLTRSSHFSQQQIDEFGRTTSAVLGGSNISGLATGNESGRLRTLHVTYDKGTGEVAAMVAGCAQHPPRRWGTPRSPSLAPLSGRFLQPLNSTDSRRPAGSIGLVVEPARADDQMDAFEWYCFLDVRSPGLEMRVTLLFARDLLDFEKVISAGFYRFLSTGSISIQSLVRYLFNPWFNLWLNIYSVLGSIFG